MNQAVQISVTHATAGVLLGTMIELVMPAHDETRSSNQQALEFAIHAGLNGAMVAFAGPYLQEEDPTGGGIFFTSLWGAQPEWRKRVTAASKMAAEQINKMVEPLLQTV